MGGLEQSNGIFENKKESAAERSSDSDMNSRKA